MQYAVFEQKIKAMPESILPQILDYAEFLMAKQNKADERKSSPKKKGFGCLKNVKCWISPDFDEPLDDFEEYM